MAQLQLSEANAKKIYPSAPSEIKAILEDTFGKEVFHLNIIDRVKTFDDILRIADKTMRDICTIYDTHDEIAYKQAKLIAEVYNEGVVLDPKNTSQYKYYPWHEIIADPSRPSGFGLSCSDYARWGTSSVVGVRLCFASAEKAIDAGKKFIEIYERLKIR